MLFCVKEVKNQEGSSKKIKMPLTESSSFPVASFLAILTLSGMQMAKPLLVSSQLMTILGGFCGSILFVFLLTAVGNLEQIIFGKGFQTKLPETVICLVAAMSASASVHRVCATTCLLFSVLMIYSMYKISQQAYGHSENESGVSKSNEKNKKKK